LLLRNFFFVLAAIAVAFVVVTVVVPVVAVAFIIVGTVVGLLHKEALFNFQLQSKNWADKKVT